MDDLGDLRGKGNVCIFSDKRWSASAHILIKIWLILQERDLQAPSNMDSAIGYLLYQLLLLSAWWVIFKIISFCFCFLNFAAFYFGSFVYVYIDFHGL